MGIILGFVGLIFIISIYVNNNSVTKAKNDILIGITLPYSELKNEEVLAIVDSYKRENVKFVVIGSIAFIPTFFITYNSFQFLYLFLWIIVLIYGSNKVFIKYNRKLMDLKREKDWVRGIYKDNDEYWKNNVYNNPNDPRTMVEKRVGYGFEYNLATKKGKIMTYGSYAIAIIIPAVLLVMFFIFDFSKFTLSIEDEVVKISAPVYGTSFEIKDIQEIELVDSISIMVRTNGIGTARYSLGNYNVKDYGNSKLYVYTGSSPYIAIKVEDKYVFITGESKEETEKYYKELMGEWKE